VSHYNSKISRALWLPPVILAIQEAEIRRIVVQSQPGKTVCETISQKNLSDKRAGGMAQGVSPEFKPQYQKKKKKKIKEMLKTPFREYFSSLPPKDSK
jgi:hypothetical protein